MNKLLDNEQHFAELNQRLNEQTARIAPHAFPADFVMDLYCECANKACVNRISIPFNQYQAVKSKLTFVVLPKHYLPEFEDIQEKHRDYWVIKKRPDKLDEPIDI